MKKTPFLFVCFHAVLSLGAEHRADVYTLENGDVKTLQIGAGDAPKLFCYAGPRFNVWRSWEEVTFEVTGQPYLPKVFGASEDDIHGLVDSYVKYRLLDMQESGSDILEKIEKRAVTRAEFFPSLFDLLTECPPIWKPNALACTKIFSPFGRSCIATSVPREPKFSSKAEFTVKLKVSFQQRLPIVMLLGFAILYAARIFAKSKFLWYFSGMSVSVILGVLILTIFLCRKIRYGLPLLTK